MNKKTTNKSKKQGYILLGTLIFIVIFKYVYNWLVEFLILNVYSPCYFASLKSPYAEIIVYPFLFIIFFAVGFYILPDRKISNKKYIARASVLLVVTLMVTIIFSSNVWVFNENSISYNTLFQKNKIVYSFDDIETAEMSTELTVTKFSITRLFYTLDMSDGRQIRFDAYDSFRKDDKRLIEFDNAIAQKRKTIGDFEYFENATSEFNEYFCSLF